VYNIRVLSSDIDFQIFSDGFYETIGESLGSNTKKISLEYLRKSDVIGVFNQKDIMVGGYIMGFSSPYRLLEFVPQEADYNLPKHFEWNKCAEIVCVWKKPEVSSYYTAKYLWPHIFSNFLNSEKKYLLGHNQSKKLNSYYSVFGPRSLYLGPSVFGLASNLFIYGRLKMYIIRFLAVTIISWTKRHR
jgi:hypothetical protein